MIGFGALDEDLIARVKEGDQEALGQLYERHFEDVVRYARSILRDTDDAYDACSEVFVTVMRKAGQYDTGATTPLRAWLFAIARNVTIDLARSRTRNRAKPWDPNELTEMCEHSEAGIAQDQPVVEHDFELLQWISDRDLAMLIGRLPIAQREALILRYHLGLNTKEIAHVMGRTPRAINDLDFRAKGFLEKRLRNLGREPQSFRREWTRRRLRRAPVLSARRFALVAPTLGVSAVLRNSASARQRGYYWT
jgi:RNA polymerase sigma-70 factor (ECF subfamily)